MVQSDSKMQLPVMEINPYSHNLPAVLVKCHLRRNTKSMNHLLIYCPCLPLSHIEPFERKIIDLVKQTFGA